MYRVTQEFRVPSSVKRYCLSLLLGSVLLLRLQMIAADGVEGNLVNTEWLERNLQNPDIVILDASPSQIYNAKHIPGAVNHDLFSYGAREIPVAETEQRYQSWGISPGKKIVMYDQGGTYMATRLFFSLEHYGFPAKDLFILDGGLAKWQEEGFPVTDAPTPSPTKGSFMIKRVNQEIQCTLPEFLVASGDTRNNVLLEALEPSWHFGENQFFGRPGHIPNAIMLPASDFFNPNKTFKSVEEIRMMLGYFGINPEQQVYSHCGGGIAASVPYFALKFMLDYPKVKLYPGSQLEWVSDQRELPFWTYDAPFLMRGSDWLQSWGGKMMKMYGLGQVSIVDVRPAHTFKQGHVPYALNVPADRFRNNITNPGKLGDILGAAGVHASHEAVVFSGTALTKDAALAFALLEKLGQKKVSIFIEPFERWRGRGLSVEKDTSAGNRIHQEAFNAPTTYQINPRSQVIVADMATTSGVYPKVFIASGNNLPAKGIEGKVVHLPYLDLLNADGTPKAAKDIWNILSKAGVPRYAELVCISDDPGEAAVNYFILKLMGFPDAKVLLM